MTLEILTSRDKPQRTWLTALLLGVLAFGPVLLLWTDKPLRQIITPGRQLETRLTLAMTLWTASAAAARHRCLAC